MKLAVARLKLRFIFVRAEVEVVERPLRVAKAGLLAPALEQPVAASRQLIRDQAGDEIDRRHGFDLGLMQACLQHGGGSGAQSLRAPETSTNPARSVNDGGYTHASVELRELLSTL